MFPVGDKLPKHLEIFCRSALSGPADAERGALNCPISNATFRTRCRNNWHSHTGGQILVAGRRPGYQAEGEPARELLPGDVVEIAPDAVHWHGAAPTAGSRIWRSNPILDINRNAARTGGRRALSAVTAGAAAIASTPSATAPAAGLLRLPGILRRGRFRGNVHVLTSAHSCGNVHVLRGAHSCGNVRILARPVLGQERGFARLRRGRRTMRSCFRVRIETCGDLIPN